MSAVLVDFTKVEKYFHITDNTYRVLNRKCREICHNKKAPAYD